MKPLALRIPQAADAVGVSERTVIRWIKNGRILAVQPGGPGTTKLVPVSELERLLNSELVLERLGASRGNGNGDSGNIG